MEVGFFYIGRFTCIMFTGCLFLRIIYVYLPVVSLHPQTAHIPEEEGQRVQEGV